MDEYISRPKVDTDVPAKPDTKQEPITKDEKGTKKKLKWDSYLNRVKRFFGRCKHSLANTGLWLFFCVVIAVVPVLSGLLVLGVDNERFSLEKSLSHGELLAISMALMGEAMGYLLTNPNVKSRLLKGFVGFGCTLILLGSALLLGVITIDKVTNTLYIMRASEIFFGGSLIVGSLCKWTEK